MVSIYYGILLKSFKERMIDFKEEDAMD